MTNNKTSNSNLSCWVMTEGMIGTQNQCVGVAEALGVEPVIMQVGLNQPWKTLSPWLGLEQSCSFTTPLTAPWPDLLIAAGRKSIAAARYIKKKSGGKTFTVQLQNPKTCPNQFDLVAAPYHDNVQGENVIATHGAPNRLTPEKLNAAHEDFKSLFAPLKAPRVAVLIGGNSRTHKLTPDIMKTLVAQLRAIDASLMITASRRTGEDNLKILQEGLKDTDAFIWDGAGDNPYFGMMAWADHILVTSDSVSMLSDAGTTGKPVHMIALEGSSTRFDRLYTHLQEIGVTQTFDGTLQTWSYDPLRDSEMVAEAITTAMQKRYG